MNRQKLYLPTDPKLPSMKSIVFVNNNSPESMVAAILNPNIAHNSRFHFMYMDNIYQGRYFNRVFRELKTSERKNVYEQVRSKVRFIRGETSLVTIAARNIYVDMELGNQIFFNLAKRAVTYRAKALEYLNYLKNTIQDPRFEGYLHKVMLVDMDAWITESGATNVMRQSQNFDNPVYLTYFALYKMVDEVKELGNIDIIFYSAGSQLRLNPSMVDKDSYRRFQVEINKFNSRVKLDEDESKLEKEMAREEELRNAVSGVLGSFKFTGETEADDVEAEEFVRTRAEKYQEENADSDPDSDSDDITTKLINDEETIRGLYDIAQKSKTGRSAVSLKRDAELREQQKKIKLDNMTLDDILQSLEKAAPIERNDISDKVKTTNKNMTVVKFPNFEKSYNTHLMKRDTISILTSLNDKSIPVFVRNIEVEDSSDEMNIKETYVVDLEDGNRVRHRLKFDMPKFVDDKFMYLNGNKKIIIKQRFMNPVVKLSPTEVQICTNYKKLFLERYGEKLSTKTEKFKKAIMTKPSGITVRSGNNTADNNKYKTTIEYDEIASSISFIRIGVVEFYFNQDEMQEIVTKNQWKIPEGELCVGMLKSGPKPTPITVKFDTQQIGSDMDIIDYIMSLDQGKLVSAFEEAKAGKKYMYTRVAIMRNIIRKQVPLVLLLSYWEGISTVLRKAEVNHYFTDKRPKVSASTQGVVEFSNGYLVYDKYPFENSLLMNAFVDIPTKGFTYDEFDSKDAYLSIFDTLYSARNVGNAFDNFHELMIDSITKEILQDYDYPTDLVSLMLFANKLLSDNSYQNENELSIYRARSNELVNAYLYQAIADAYARYRMTANNNNPVKISIPRDAITKKLLMAQNVEDYSILNPIVELEKSRAISPKGLSGLNLDAAYTQDKRSFDKSMLGVMAMSTSPDANVGIVRQLTMEPNIKNARGYFEDNSDNLDELKDTNLFSPAELLSPLGVSRDDAIRTAMATKQSKHIIPIEKSSPVLISNGAEQVIPYHLSDDFSVVAKQDGEVVEIDEKNGMIIVGYYNNPKDKSAGFSEYKAIDIKPRVVKNGAGGFFLSVQLQSKLKVGSKFTRNDILAYDGKFFSDSKMDGIRFNIGSIQKIACMSSYSTYEDSTFITKKLSEDMAADIVMQKSVVLGKNANVDYIVKVGDQIKVGDELMRFEMSFEDDSINKFLSNIGDSLKEEIKSLGKTPIKSKYSGVIEDIKVYTTVDVEQLSPSLRKIVEAYHGQIEKKRKLLSKYDKSDSYYKLGVILNEPTKKIDTKDGKVKGNEVGEGVLIEFYIKYRDIMGVGDKITFFTALKSIIGEVIPEGYEPSSEFRPTEEVSSFIAPGAVLARMTPSILQTALGYKVIVELKRKLYTIATGREWTPDTF